MKLLASFLCVFFLSACLFSGPGARKRLAQAAAAKPIDVAIIPGLPLRNGSWDTLLKARILWSEFLIKKGYVSNVLYSGNAVYTAWTEGPCMALYARALGIDSAHILVDTLAEHSTENLYYGYQLARQKGYKTIALATDPFQCTMLRGFVKKNDLQDIYFIPLIYDSIAARTSFECRIDTLLYKKKSFVPITKREDYKNRYKRVKHKSS